MQSTTATCFRKAGFITNAKTAKKKKKKKKDKNGGEEAICDAWSNLQEKLNIKSTFKKNVKADDALSSCEQILTKYIIEILQPT
jgi:hypothetical protein